MHLLITAGPTREYIDSVRYLSNDSSGRMGVALAAAGLKRKHRVTLVHGPLTVAPPRRARRIAITSASEMLDACRGIWPACDALLMSAAVADYAPRRRQAHKHKKSGGPWRLELVPTPDVLASLAGERRADQTVIGFALEDCTPRRNAADKLRRKGLDAIILNRPAAISASRASVEILVPRRPWERFGPSAKSLIAARIVRLAEQLHVERTAARGAGRSC